MAGNDALSGRYIDEKLGPHWQVDHTGESFRRLLYHLEVATNFRPYFEEALSALNLDSDKFGKDLLIADVGSGICWASAILAKHSKVKRIYAVDPSANRLGRGSFVAKHFGTDAKLAVINGTFQEPNVPEKVDLVVLCASLHLCYD